MKEIAVLMVLALVVLMGCTQPPAATPTATPTIEPTVAPTAVPTAKASPTPTPFQSLKLDYEVKGTNGPQSVLDLSLWLTEERECSGKKAVLGFMNLFEPGRPENQGMWQKVAIYNEDGSIAYSKSLGKNELAFDGAKSAATDFDFFLTLNSVFAAAGQNFNKITWTKTPVILSQVQFGSGTSDLSITMIGESTKYALPCTEFAIISKTGGPGEIKACVAKKGVLPQPFVVNFVVGDQMQVSLKSKSSEAPSAAFFAQCLTPAKCKAVTLPTQEEEQACQAKNSQYEQVRDESNCVVKYECKTTAEIVKGQLEQSQRSGCVISDALLNQAVKCRENHQNWNGQSGNDGCLKEVTCQ